MSCEICKSTEKTNTVTVIHWKGGREFRILTCGECGDRVRANIISMMSNIVSREEEEHIGERLYKVFHSVHGVKEEEITPWNNLPNTAKIAWVNSAYVVIEWWKGRVAESMVRGA